MAKRRRVRWDRVILVFGPLLLLILIQASIIWPKEVIYIVFLQMLLLMV